MNVPDRWAPHPERSNSFDHAILTADRRAWHPLRIDAASLAAPFDMEATPMLPPHMVMGLETACVREHLSTAALRTRFTNEVVRIYLSDILHGERAALAHAARLCLSTTDLGAQESAANQAREEARHVTAFSLYIARRWGEPVAPTPVFADCLSAIATAGSLLQGIAGMQLLIEGLAMGVFAALESEFRDPLGRELMRQVMADEASHLKTGATWMSALLCQAPAADRDAVEVWTARQFVRLSRGLFAPTQRADLYARFGLDPKRVGRELHREGCGRLRPSVAATIFRTAAKAIARAGLISARTRSAYASFL